MRLLTEADDPFWLDVAARSPEATFFHTPIWRSLVTRTFPEFRDLTTAAELPGGRHALLPLLETGRSARGTMPDAVSTFGGCYGGLVADGEVPPAERARLLAAILKERRVGSLQMTSNPLASPGELSGRFTASDYSTHIVDLAPGWEKVQAGFSRGNLSSIRKGRRLGVEVREGSSPDDYRAYFEIYERSLERWGERATSRYPWRLFEAGLGLAKEHPGRIRLWLAGRDSKVMAGAWVFYWNQHAVYWHGATDVAHSEARPANVLHAAILEDACARGYRHYDFNPSGGHQGVARFKSGFGGAVVPLRVWTYRSAALDAYRSIRRLLP